MTSRRGKESPETAVHTQKDMRERRQKLSPITRKDIAAPRGFSPHQENPYGWPPSQGRTENISDTAGGLHEAAEGWVVALGSSGCPDGAVLLSRVRSGWSCHG